MNWKLGRGARGALFAVALAVAGAAMVLTMCVSLAATAWLGRAHDESVEAANLVVTARQSLPQSEDVPVALPELAPLPGDALAQLRGLPGVESAWAVEERDGRPLVVAVTSSATARVTAAEVRQALGTPDAAVFTGERKADAVVPGLGAARVTLAAMAATMAGVVLLTAAMVVAGAANSVVRAGRRTIAQLRAIGATPRQARRVVVRGVLLVAAAAMPVGGLAGYWLLDQARELLITTGVLPAGLGLVTGPWPILAVALVLVPIAGLSASLAAMGVSRLSPSEALTESQTESAPPRPWRITAGLAVIGLAMAISALPAFVRTAEGAVGTSSAGLLAIVGLAMCGASLISALAGVLTRAVQRRAPTTTWLAVANTKGNAVRLATGLSSLAMLIILAFTSIGTQFTLMHAADLERAAGGRGTVLVSGEGLDRTTVDEMLAASRGPVAATQATSVFREYKESGNAKVAQYSTMAAGPELAKVVDLDVTTGTMDLLTGASVALSERAARQFHAKVGDKVPLILGDGRKADARVVAVYTRGSGFAEAIVSSDLAREHLAAAPWTLWFADSAEAAAIESAHRAGLTRTPIEEAGTPTIAEMSPDMLISFLAMVILLGYVMVAVAMTLAATTSRRREEFASLRLLGMTRPQVMSMIRQEAGVTALLAIVMGGAIAAVPVLVVSRALTGTLVPAMPWWLPAIACGSVALLAWGTTVLPARQAMAGRPR